MALLDDPRRLIDRMFELAEREGQTNDVRRFPQGSKPDGIPESSGVVYGIFKNKYYFGVDSLAIRDDSGFQIITWRDIAHCSSQHGSGAKVAELTLVDGTICRVRVGDFGKGWGGRMSQLFHSMIEKFGNRATLGIPLMSIAEFFATATDDYDIAPNLDPHPTLSEFRAKLEHLRSLPGVRDVLLYVGDMEGGKPVVEGAVIRGDVTEALAESYASEILADGAVVAWEEIRRKVPELAPNESLWHLGWD